MNRILLALLAILTLAQRSLAEEFPTWTRAQQQPAFTADETKAFMKKLLLQVKENHLKRDPATAQKGMVYEYFDTTRKGKPGQWVQGEALDTMHDGAWLA